MTGIKIPLSIDHRASECLEEYGTYHRWSDMTLNDRCLIGYILKTIRDTVPTTKVDAQDNAEWTAEDLSSLEIWVTTCKLEDPKWYWKVEPQANVETGCRYSIEVVSTEWDTITYIGTVDRLTTLLAILCSEVDFSFVPSEDTSPDTIMLMKARTGIIKGLNVDQVQKTAIETYKKVGGTIDLRDYMSDLRQAIGSGALNGKPELTISGKKSSGSELEFYINLRLYDTLKDRPWNTSLGTTNNIIAALIITCSGVEYSGEIAPTFPKGEGLDVQTLEELATEAYNTAKLGDNYVPICDYIADTFRGMGYGVAVRQGLQYHVMVREAGSKATKYKVTPINKHYGIVDFDVNYYTDDSTLYLGRVSSVTAVIAIVCTSLSFRGKES